MKKINKTKLVDTWGNTIKKTTGINESEKISWMSELAHAQALNENQSAGLNMGSGVRTNTLHNTLGIGNVVPPSQAKMTAGEQASTQGLGSGDQYPSLLPIAIKVAAKTIGLDLVNTHPLQGPTGMIAYMDYVYAGSKNPYGASPSTNLGNANPDGFGHKFDEDGKPTNEISPAHVLYSLPHAFKAALVVSEGAKDKKDFYDAVKAGEIAKNAILTISALGEAPTDGEDEEGNPIIKPAPVKGSVYVQFIGVSRIDANPMFKVVSGNTDLGSVFAGDDVKVELVKDDKSTIELTVTAPKLISMMEDQILGFAGSGKYDTDAWTGTYQDGTKLFEPMSRGTGEMQYPRQMSLQMFTKLITVGTQQVSVAVTHEMVTDLQKQWKIDATKMIENAAVAELTQNLNKHILSRLFGLGWKNHIKINDVEGVNLNINVDSKDADLMTPSFAYPATGDGSNEAPVIEANKAMAIRPAFIREDAQYENMDSIFKRIQLNILAASNYIMQRGRRGGGTFVVTNIRVATALQSSAQYSAAPIANSISQTSGSLYPLGQIAGMQVYVDPTMAAYDTRVLVGRKGSVTQEETGVLFCPYLLAESIKFTGEFTGAQRIIIKSRYALVDYGHHPETSYFTFFVKMNSVNF